MKVLYRRCAGLDVHKDTVVACARIQSRKVTTELATFGTKTRDLLALAEWLHSRGVTHAAMEATGVYWKPVWYVLEDHFELVLANAAHIRNVPGRKTDAKDAEWIADLLAHGLIRASFVPPKPVQALRDLTRTRKQLVRESVSHTQRIQKVLESANVRLSSVVSDVLGYTGRAVIEAFIAGRDDPLGLLELKHPQIQASDEDFVEALRGRIGDHERFLLRLHLSQIDALAQAIEQIDAQLERALEPFRREFELLNTIPGVKDILAAVILAEIGTDMSRFPTDAHLLSWAGLCPRSDESAGKRRSTRLRKSGNWLKTHLVQAAWGAVKKKDLYPRTQFLRLKGRRGPKKAIIAVAASLLTAAYHILREHKPYHDLGPSHLDHLKATKTVERLLRRLANLGVQVTIQRQPAA